MNDFQLMKYDNDGKCFFIKVTLFKGETEDYGPFSLFDLKRLKNEKRIDGSVFIYHSDFDSWKILADAGDYKKVFDEDPPEVTSYQRRVMTRKELLSSAMLINPFHRFNVETIDISMMALKIKYNQIDYEFNLDEEFELIIEHKKFENVKFKVKVLRLFDSTGFDHFLTLKFNDLTKTQRDLISEYVLF